MVINPRKVPEDLAVLRILNPRMNLTEKEKQNYLILEKGFEGELVFDSLSENLQSENLISNGLLLDYNNSIFQIDSLISFQKSLYLIDVKNFEGDYYFKEDGFYYGTGKPMKDPLAQLKRCHLLLSQLNEQHGYNLHIESYLVFINPEFTLYHAPENQQIILPTQVNRFINKLNTVPSKITDRNIKHANLLISLKLDKNPFSKIPAYDYDKLQKMLTCVSCNSISIIVGRTKLTCGTCSCVEDVESAVMRCVDELRLLFPEKKITTRCVFEWCGGIVPERQIRRILNENFAIVGKYRFAHYR
ncbi:nuclease-related domain-containing protein [Neobacillus niacini]|uniref:nuclease-related domain-containing protein n=1 Tax=Neobacillus niacini TaxID=86668 RepID=UPI002FFEDB7C